MFTQLPWLGKNPINTNPSWLFVYTERIDSGQCKKRNVTWVLFVIMIQSVRIKFLSSFFVCFYFFIYFFFFTLCHHMQGDISRGTWFSCIPDTFSIRSWQSGTERSMIHDIWGIPKSFSLFWKFNNIPCGDALCEPVAEFHPTLLTFRASKI